jgi:Arc/MetJ family transcription regulator
MQAHGSTVTGVLAVAEAMTAADIAGAVVLADDFGDDLDAASGEFLAAVLRRTGDQVWLSTRRPEVVRAFDPTEVLRLTRSHGERRHHQLGATTDKKARLARRQLHLLLLPAMTTRSVALLEGPHDRCRPRTLWPALVRPAHCRSRQASLARAAGQPAESARLIAASDCAPGREQIIYSVRAMGLDGGGLIAEEPAGGSWWQLS